MNIKRKRNLILVQAFPANENLSEGVIKFLDQFFNVYFINLPGFHKKVEPLQNVSMENYIKYVEDEIRKLDLDEYILGGMSFGFALISQIKIDKSKVKAIIGFAPFINHNYLRYGKYYKKLIQLVTEWGVQTDLLNRLWYKKQFRNIVKYAWVKKSSNIIESIMEDVNPDTFIKTSNLLVNNDNEFELQDIPHILFINANDKTINSLKVLEKFYESLDAKNLRVIFTDIPHYPKNPTFEYFKKNVNEESIEAIFKFLDYIDSQT